MNNKRLLYLILIVATLTIGVVIGSIVSGGVKAGEQKPAPLIIPDPVSLSNAFSQIAAQLNPAVVNISTESKPEQPQARGGRGRGQQQAPDPFGFFNFFGGAPDQSQDQKVTSVGSGFIVDKAGYILTNEHVVDKADKITVRLEDKSEYPGKVIGSDSDTDLAVVKIDVGRDLPVAKLGNSDAVKVGDWVLAIGSPFSFDHSVTAGIISAKGRNNAELGSNQFQNFLQTDAAINPGNSGGPLVNMAGEVIGVNTAIISETRQFAGLGFALPSSLAANIYNQLVKDGKVTRGYIGIQYTQDPDPAMFRAFGIKNNEGVIVQDVPPGGPAAKVGVRPGDIITEIDGKKTPTPGTLLDIVANSPVGKTIQVRINRDGKEQMFPIVVEDRAKSTAVAEGNVPAPPGGGGGDNQGPSIQTKIGIQVQAITSDMMRQLGLKNTDGVVISAVQPGSVAAEAGMDTGMVITRMKAPGSQFVDIHNMDDFDRAQKQLKSGMDVAFMVMIRNGGTNSYRSLFVAVTIP